MDRRRRIISRNMYGPLQLDYLDGCLTIITAILDPLTEPQIPPLVLTRILTHHLKPIFAANPHPRLNLQTGRKLPRPADTQDAYEGQVWKTRIGIGNVLGWCLRNIEVRAADEQTPQKNSFQSRRPAHMNQFGT